MISLTALSRNVKLLGFIDLVSFGRLWREALLFLSHLFGNTPVVSPTGVLPPWLLWTRSVTGFIRKASATD